MKLQSSEDWLDVLVGDCRMYLDEFLPKCMSAVDDLIGEIDYNYGDAQLETTLRNFCSHAQEFPKSHGNADGFLSEMSCVEFAGDLWKARMLELKTTKTSGYKDFCTKFYEHHGGRAEVKQPKKEKEVPWKGGASTPNVLFMGVVMSFLVAAN